MSEFVAFRALGLELRSAVHLRGVGVAAERRWELALWTLNPAIAVQIRARSCAQCCSDDLRSLVVVGVCLRLVGFSAGVDPS